MGAKVYEGFPAEYMEPSDEETEEDQTLANEDLLSKKRTTLDDSEDSMDEMEDGEEEDGELLNRPVTYEIEKNKPKKKSAPNNPRVKHREKFRKAKIRRKGKIRDFKPEFQKYRGEASGIRPGIVRSVRFK